MMNFIIWCKRKKDDPLSAKINTNLNLISKDGEPFESGLLIGTHCATGSLRWFHYRLNCFTTFDVARYLHVFGNVLTSHIQSKGVCVFHSVGVGMRFTSEPLFQHNGSQIGIIFLLVLLVGVVVVLNFLRIAKVLGSIR